VQGLEWAVLALLVGIAAGAGIGISMYRNTVQSRLRQVEAEQRLQLEAARSEQKDIVLRATDEALRLRSEAEAQIREARAGLAKQEERLQRKEENLDRKLEGLERRERQMQTRDRQTELIQQEAEQMRNQQRTELERVSALSQEEARTIILQKVEAEARDDAARRIREIERGAREEADKLARKVIGLAIQRCASDYVAEVTVSTVALPGE
jgi:ribonuclease Y